MYLSTSSFCPPSGIVPAQKHHKVHAMPAQNCHQLNARTSGSLCVCVF